MPTAARPFLDTNVLLYALAAGDPRAAVAHEVLAQGGVVSVQVLNEFASVARRKLGMTWPEVDAVLDAVVTLCPDPVPLTLDLHSTGLRVAARHNTSVYDAMIVAAALQAGCDTLWTEDIATGTVIDRRLAIRNPFV